MAVKVGDLFLLSVLVTGLVTLCLGCSPPAPGTPKPTLTEMVYHSQTVFHGRVLEKTRDSHMSSGSHDAFVASVKVFCILRGDRTPEVITVSMLGVIGGRCTRIDMDVGEEYIFMGYRMDETTVAHNDMASVTASEDNINLVTAACDLEVMYPEGVDRTTAERHCPRSADATTCVPDEHEPAHGIEDQEGHDHDHDDHHHGDGDDHDHEDYGDYGHDDDDHDHEDGDHDYSDNDQDGDHDHDDHHHGDGEEYGDYGHDNDGEAETQSPEAAAAKSKSYVATSTVWLTVVLYFGALLLPTQ